MLAERPESATLLRRLDQLEGEQADLRRQAEQMEAELALLGTDVMVDDRQLATLSERALRHLAGDDLRQARHALAAYVKEILVDPGKPIAVTVVYTVPYPAPGETSGPARSGWSWAPRRSRSAAAAPLPNKPKTAYNETVSLQAV